MKLIDPTTQENIRIAINSIKSHLLRSVLTVYIFAFGIMALVGIMTSISAIEYFLVENFTRMGSNTFTIRYQSMRMGGERHQANMNKVISWEEAIEFKKNYTFPSSISIYIFANGNTTVKFGSNKTYPNIRIFGADENYLLTSGETIEKGRNFSSADAWQGTHVAILGEAVAKNIFGETVDPLGKIVSVGPGKYMVIGILKSKGSSIGFSNDRTVILPIQNVRERFVQPDQSYSIAVMPPTSASMDAASGEAIGVFRTIRKLKLNQENNFGIIRSDSLVEMMKQNTAAISLAATFIGFITLIGAAIGLMNILLVSVTERTREIGIRKALGATRKTIRNQFLAEAIVIAQIGGAFGIILGIAIGNIVSYIIGSIFIIPWLWIILGVILCAGVALASGFLPARKAANLEPIEALRYE